MTTAVTSRQLEATLIAPSKASRIHRFGGPEVITLEDMGPVAPGRGEVLVRVKAAGVGPWDAWIRGQERIATTSAADPRVRHFRRGGGGRAWRHPVRRGRRGLRRN